MSYLHRSKGSVVPTLSFRDSAILHYFPFLHVPLSLPLRPASWSHIPPQKPSTCKPLAWALLNLRAMKHFIFFISLFI